MILVCCINRDSPVSAYIEDGEFDLYIEDGGISGFKGVVDFRETTTTVPGSARFSQWHFTLKTDRPAEQKEIELFITRPLDNEGIYEQTFSVAEDVNSLLEPAEGLFGAAVMAGVSEWPFFARNGQVKIKERKDNTIRGTMDLSMENSAGEQIRIKGGFAAQAAEHQDNLGIFSSDDLINTETPSRVAL